MKSVQKNNKRCPYNTEVTSWIKLFGKEQVLYLSSGVIFTTSEASKFRTQNILHNNSCSIYLRIQKWLLNNLLVFLCCRHVSLNEQFVDFDLLLCICNSRLHKHTLIKKKWFKRKKLYQEKGWSCGPLKALDRREQSETSLSLESDFTSQIEN